MSDVGAVARLASAPADVGICRYNSLIMSAPPITIPAFPGGKRIAVTTSFDDGVIHDRRVVEAFNEWGLKGTFNLNSGRLLRPGQAPQGSNPRIQASDIAELFVGHEIAIHTVTHPRLTQLDSSQVALEVLDDRRALEDLVGYPVRGMAYPYGDYDTRVIEVLRALGIRYARTTENHPRPFPPAEPLAFATTMHQYATEPDDVPTRFEKMLGGSKTGLAFFVWGHTFEFNNRDDWASLERIYKPLSGHAVVWYCTNIELFDYEDARQRLVIAANRKSVYNPSAIPVTIEIGGKLMDIPGGLTQKLDNVS
jgi:peptidoglycan/xylan/chitin deacetylase (PgdA/CDA1 family)